LIASDPSGEFIDQVLKKILAFAARACGELA
jgi:hypothetical protein